VSGLDIKRFTAVIGGRAGRTIKTRSIEEITAEHEAESLAARAYGPLSMRLDDDDSSIFEAAVAAYEQALTALDNSEALTPEQKRIVTALPRFAVREAGAGIGSALTGIGAVLDVSPFVWEVEIVGVPGLTDLASCVHDYLREDHADGLVGFGGNTVRTHARRITHEAAAYLLYRHGVKADPVRAARAAGLSEEKAPRSTALTQAAWQQIMRAWIDGVVEEGPVEGRVAAKWALSAQIQTMLLAKAPSVVALSPLPSQK
jgi:hypothetical protein